MSGQPGEGTVQNINVRIFKGLGKIQKRFFKENVFPVTSWHKRVSPFGNQRNMSDVLTPFFANLFEEFFF